MALAATFIVAALSSNKQALADCFSQEVIEDDAYKGFRWTNNCASWATVTTVRKYKKQNGADAVDTNTFKIGPCIVFKNQLFQGKYENIWDVDESKICIPKASARPTGVDTTSKEAIQAIQASKGKPAGQDGSGTASDSGPIAGGTDYAAAERAAERMQFERAEKIDSIDGWLIFLKAFPNGDNSDWAKQRLKELGYADGDQ
jgi:hypothetical protein